MSSRYYVGGVLIACVLFLLFRSFNEPERNIASNSVEIPIRPQHVGKDRVICFHTISACERGTDVAIYDYADFSESILGHTSVILIPDRPDARIGAGLPKYLKRFGNNTIFYKPDVVAHLNDEKKMINELLPGKSFPMEAKRAGCDFVYTLKGGKKDSFPRYPEAFNARYSVLYFIVCCWFILCH